MEIKKNNKVNLEKVRIIFLQVGFIMALAAILIAFETNTKIKEEQEQIVRNEDIAPEDQVEITRQEQQPEEPPPPVAPIELNIVNDEAIIDDQFVMEDMSIDEDMSMEFVPYDEEESAGEEIFVIVEDMPKFRGGDQGKFREWVQKSVVYPQIAVENGIEGKVGVNFVVNEEGRVVNVRIVRPVDPSLDNEVLKVVKRSPKWSPGKQRGKAVKVQFTIPIVFVLQ